MEKERDSWIEVNYDFFSFLELFVIFNTINISR